MCEFSVATYYLEEFFLSKTDDNRNVDRTAISFGAGKSRTL